MASFNEWQRQQKALKDFERDRLKRASLERHNYRGGEEDCNDIKLQKVQKELKEAERERKKRASMERKTYRGGEHDIQHERKLWSAKNDYLEEKKRASLLRHNYQGGEHDVKDYERDIIEQRKKKRNSANYPAPGPWWQLNWTSGPNGDEEDAAADSAELEYERPSYPESPGVGKLREFFGGGRSTKSSSVGKLGTDTEILMGSEEPNAVARLSISSGGKPPAEKKRGSFSKFMARLSSSSREKRTSENSRRSSFLKSIIPFSNSDYLDHADLASDKSDEETDNNNKKENETTNPGEKPSSGRSIMSLGSILSFSASQHFDNVESENINSDDGTDDNNENNEIGSPDTSIDQNTDEVLSESHEEGDVDGSNDGKDENWYDERALSGSDDECFDWNEIKSCDDDDNWEDEDASSAGQNEGSAGDAVQTENDSNGEADRSRRRSTKSRRSKQSCRSTKSRTPARDSIQSGISAARSSAEQDNSLPIGHKDYFDWNSVPTDAESEGENRNVKKVRNSVRSSRNNLSPESPVKDSKVDEGYLSATLADTSRDDDEEERMDDDLKNMYDQKLRQYQEQKRQLERKQRCFSILPVIGILLSVLAINIVANIGNYEPPVPMLSECRDNPVQTLARIKLSFPIDSNYSIAMKGGIDGWKNLGNQIVGTYNNISGGCIEVHKRSMISCSYADHEIYNVDGKMVMDTYWESLVACNNMCPILDPLFDIESLQPITNLLTGLDPILNHKMQLHQSPALNTTEASNGSKESRRGPPEFPVNRTEFLEYIGASSVVPISRNVSSTFLPDISLEVEFEVDGKGLVPVIEQLSVEATVSGLSEFFSGRNLENNPYSTATTSVQGDFTDFRVTANGQERDCKTTSNNEDETSTTVCQILVEVAVEIQSSSRLVAARSIPKPQWRREFDEVVVLPRSDDENNNSIAGTETGSAKLLDLLVHLPALPSSAPSQAPSVAPSSSASPSAAPSMLEEDIFV